MFLGVLIIVFVVLGSAGSVWLNLFNGRKSNRRFKKGSLFINGKPLEFTNKL